MFKPRPQHLSDAQNPADKYMSLDINLLRKHIPFDYLQLFELSTDGVSSCFTEYPVPAEVEVPKDNRFAAVSARATMRLSLSAEPTGTIMPKEELLTNWDFNIIAVIIQRADVPVLLLFYSRNLPARLPDAAMVSAALRSI